VLIENFNDLGMVVGVVISYGGGCDVNVRYFVGLFAYSTLFSFITT
jgi:hypothetical protein